MGIVKWEEVLTIKNGRNQKAVANINGQYPIYGSGGVMGYADDYLCNEGTTIIGRKGSINNPIYVDCKFWNVDTAFGLVPGDKLDNKYFYYFCLTYNFLKHNKATTLPSLTKTDLLKIQIPLPLLPVQQKIAAILDEADQLRQLNKQLIAKYDELTQSLFLDMFGDPVTNPKKLPIITLGELGKWQSGGTPSRSNNSYFEGSIPWLSSGELESLYISDSKEHISELAIKESSARIVPDGSLLLGMYDTAALKSTISAASLSCNQAIAFSRLDDSLVNTLYVYYIIQIGKEHYRRLQRGVRQKNLNLSMVKGIKILYPSLNLQNQFAKRVQAIEAQKAQAQQGLEKAEELFNSLLQRAFKGEL